MKNTLLISALLISLNALAQNKPAPPVQPVPVNPSIVGVVLNEEINTLNQHLGSLVIINLQVTHGIQTIECQLCHLKLLFSQGSGYQIDSTLVCFAPTNVDLVLVLCCLFVS